MTLEKRLRKSHILMLVIPAFLIMFTGGMVRSLYGHDSKELLSVDLVDEIYSLLMENPDLLQNNSYLESLGKKYEEADFLLKKGDILVSASFDFHSHGKIAREHFLEMGHEGSQWPVLFSDGSIGRLIMIPSDPQWMRKQGILRILFIPFVILIFIVTNGFLTFRITRAIVSPLRRLQAAADSISHDNLDFTVDYERNDEIKAVFTAFDNMRLRLKLSLEARDRAEQNRRELLANISHDLKTPITSIRGYVEGLIEGVAHDADRKMEYMQTIHSKALLLDRLIDQLFLYSKLDLNQQPFDIRSIHLQDFLVDTLGELSLDYGGMKIRLDIDREPSLQIWGDPLQLNRVITNLVSNAFKYNDDSDPSLCVTAHCDDSWVTLCFKDNGIGMNEGEISHIFEHFYRSDPARSSSREGSGLGLAISGRIIKGLGGKIWAESTPSEGSSIFVQLRRDHG